MSNIKKVQQLVDQQMEAIQVSSATGNSIQNGIKIARRKRQRKTNIVFSLSAIAVLFLSFTFLARVSPAFAQIFENMPGLGAIVAIVEYDRGIEDSVLNNYYEEIGVSAQESGVTFTLDGVIADESGMLLSYSIESSNPINDFQLGKTVLLQNEKELGLVYATSELSQDEPVNKLENTVKISDPSGEIDYTNPAFKLEFSVIGEEEIEFAIPFELKNKIAKPKYYKVNQEVLVAGQKFTVEQVKISPLLAAIEITTDAQNDMVIFDFASIELQDENGDIWGSGSSSSSGFGSADTMDRTINLESNYFQQPKELFLVIGDIVALPKDEREIVIDFDKKEVVSMSEQYPLQLEYISEEGFVVRLDEHLHYKHTLFNNGLDTNGKNVALSVSNRFSDKENFQVFTLEKGMYENPVTFELQGYPNYLENDISIKIK